ncbi:MAG: hypothetical protein ACYDBB_00820 [Armatimonadota bacterium]
MSTITLRWIAVFCCILGATSLMAASDIAGILQRAPALNPNLTDFPDSSLIDRSSSLDAPAGKYGFVTVKDGHFVFANGERARFFGLNLAKETLFIQKPLIDKLVVLFARSGVNLVRIHHIDDMQGILDPAPERFFRPEKLDLVDYWVAKLREQGIYVCLDLNDYRTFRSEEGVQEGESLGRGAKPYAVFDQRLIELQQEYARRFLVEHVNPYTRLSYANDPAIAFLEIYDENGLFIRRSDWPNLIDPYKTALQQRWNDWLIQRYGTTTALKAAWTDSKGACALLPTESLETAMVLMPRMDLGSNVNPAFTDPLIAPARQSDGALFAAEVQERYLRTMMTSLRKMGVKVPITAVGAQDIIPELMSLANTTDYIGINYYWDHPSWSTGNEWTMPAYFSLKNPYANNPEYSFPVTVSMARMAGKPLVVRELGYCYPNPYRGAGMIEAAAYGSFLDVDALILFTYDANLKSHSIGYFDIRLDPLRWGLVAQASRLYLSGDMQPARTTVGIGYSQVDAFTWENYLSPLYQLAFATRVVNYTDMTAPHPYDLLVTSGRSCGSQWLGSRLLLFANENHTDLRFQGRAIGLDERQGYRLAYSAGGAYDMTFHGVGYDAGVTKQVQAWPSFTVADLMAKGFFPIASNDKVALGFVDSQRKVMGFHNLRPELAVRMTADALRDWSNAAISHIDQDKNVWRTDTLEIERDMNAGLLRVDTPKFQALAGDFTSADALHTSMLKMSTTTPVGTLTMECLDNKALSESVRFLVKMTSKARNDLIRLAPSTDGPKAHKLSDAGNAPVRTDGKAADQPTRVDIKGIPLIEVYLRNGSWEYLVEPDRSLLYIDTGDVTVRLPQRPKLIRWHTEAGGTINYDPRDLVFTVPGGVRYTEIVW